MAMSLLAAVLFAASAVCGQRTSRQLGGITANGLRITLACLVLCGLTATWQLGSVHPQTFGWLFLSGVLGFGLGDIALFTAYPLLGARLAVLINICVATFVAAAADDLLLGTHLAERELMAAAIVVTGVVLALHRRDEPLRWNAGLVLALIAGVCQGLGLTVSRIAQGIAHEQHLPLSGIAQACQRALGGVCVGWIALAVLQWSIYRERQQWQLTRQPVTPVRFWLLGSAFFGPIAGISVLQVALQEMGTSAIVSAITAMAPLILLPITMYIDHERPTFRAISGSIVAVAGVVLLAFVR